MLWNKLFKCRFKFLKKVSTWNYRTVNYRTEYVQHISFAFERKNIWSSVEPFVDSCLVYCITRKIFQRNFRPCMCVWCKQLWLWNHLVTFANTIYERLYGFMQDAAWIKIWKSLSSYLLLRRESAARCMKLGRSEPETQIWAFSRSLIWSWRNQNQFSWESDFST